MYSSLEKAHIAKQALHAVQWYLVRNTVQSMGGAKVTTTTTTTTTTIIIIIVINIQHTFAVIIGGCREATGHLHGARPIRTLVTNRCVTLSVAGSKSRTSSNDLSLPVNAAQKGAQDAGLEHKCHSQTHPQAVDAQPELERKQKGTGDANHNVRGQVGYSTNMLLAHTAQHARGHCLYAIEDVKADSH